MGLLVISSILLQLRHALGQVLADGGFLGQRCHADGQQRPLPAWS
jgi:hypothetical protein